MEVLPKFWPRDCDHYFDFGISPGEVSVMSPASGLWLALTITQNAAVFGGGEIPWPDRALEG